MYTYIYYYYSLQAMYSLYKTKTNNRHYFARHYIPVAPKSHCIKNWLAKMSYKQKHIRNIDVISPFVLRSAHGFVKI